MTRLLCILALVLAAGGRYVHAAERFDVVVYGGTAGGAAAAIHAARMGRTVVLVEPSSHLGGMTTGGLGATDIGAKTSIGGIAREFYARVYKHYLKPDAWTHETRDDYLPKHSDNVSETLKLHWFFEPKVAQSVLRAMLDESGATVVLNERLDRETGVTKDGARIREIRMESGRTFTGRIFVDCTYEGDLMAAAGVRYTVGREPNSQYDETLNGVVPMGLDKSFGVDPFVVPGDRATGTVFGVDAALPGDVGTGDRRVQAYTFRVCLTDVPQNRVAIEKPVDFEPRRYELVARLVQAHPQVRPGKMLFKLTPVPNRKTDSNNLGSFSTDFVGASYGWAEASYAERERMWQEHRSYVQGLFWFLANDARVPAPIREEVSRWGLPRDEFTQTSHWPPQLYVREARRMIGRYVVTEHDCRHKLSAEDPVGIASYPMDSHQVSRFADENGKLRLEGAFLQRVKPYGVSFKSITPKPDECTNLLVPVCLSASHVAYGSIRMEPVFMILGQSAATAAALAIEGDVDVQAVAYERLRDRLQADGQILKMPAAR